MRSVAGIDTIGEGDLMRQHMLACVLTIAAIAGSVRGDDEIIAPMAHVQGDSQYLDRFYVAGILGTSFGTLTVPGAPSATDPLFSPGGALGYSWEVEDDSLRLEIEGRQREPIAAPASLDDFGTSHISATGGWSATVNLWRDYAIHDRVTCYLGGGIGAGGYQFGINQDFPIQDASITGLGTATGFAWQAGGGVAWAITDSLTLDLGYRFFDLGAGGINAQLSQTGVPIGTERFTSAFSASEIFFAFRLYEPFRGWW